MLLPLALLASCAATTRLGGSGRAPAGYEPFICFPAPFRFRAGTAEMVDDPENPTATWYDAGHRRDEWIVLTLLARSASGAPVGRALLHRRASAVLGWLSGQGRRRDRVEIRIDAGVTPPWSGDGADASRTRSEVGGSVTGMISHALAEEHRVAEARGTIFC